MRQFELKFQPIEALATFLYDAPEPLSNRHLRRRLPFRPVLAQQLTPKSVVGLAGLDRNGLRSIDGQADRIIFGIEHQDRNIVADDEALMTPPRKNYQCSISSCLGSRTTCNRIGF